MTHPPHSHKERSFLPRMNAGASQAVWVISASFPYLATARRKQQPGSLSPYMEEHINDRYCVSHRDVPLYERRVVNLLC